MWICLFWYEPFFQSIFQSECVTIFVFATHCSKPSRPNQLFFQFFQLMFVLVAKTNISILHGWWKTILEWMIFYMNRIYINECIFTVDKNILGGWPCIFYQGGWKHVLPWMCCCVNFMNLINMVKTRFCVVRTFSNTRSSTCVHELYNSMIEVGALARF